MAKRYWMSTPPEKCDLCGKRITQVFVDGKTSAGPWGCLCPACHKAYGFGLGLGLGQRYERQKDGEWLKTGG